MCVCVCVCVYLCAFLLFVISIPEQVGGLWSELGCCITEKKEEEKQDAEDIILSY